MEPLNVLFVLFLSFQFITADCPAGTISTGTSASEQTQIINLHNGIRNNISRNEIPGQPRGKNFQKMEWDATLAAEAQDVANTCTFAHVTISDKRWGWVGQNLYISSSTSQGLPTNWDKAFDGWTVGEYPSYTYGNTYYNHYTQVVWANTKYVGCALSFYKQSNGWYSKLYVCNYGPGGNYVGEYPYEKA